jgi:hypothetical protein
VNPEARPVPWMHTDLCRCQFQEKSFESAYLVCDDSKRQIIYCEPKSTPDPVERPGPSPVPAILCHPERSEAQPNGVEGPLIPLARPRSSKEFPAELRPRVLPLRVRGPSAFLPLGRVPRTPNLLSFRRPREAGQEESPVVPGRHFTPPNEVQSKIRLPCRTSAVVSSS